ncbi:sigma-70 family RNA polymerase sigma factor [Rhizobium sp. S95]|uniref:Sigma-70 family RNA polymerase sigma factor n=1 Tax=Ciceribacter sichuanensis TaxID=2949647 RepID=A0AAJ1C039_9HYPH|nr:MULTISPECIES: sigma-70 family RNA polymerase sigma factor [unclassified Ciceribacter]MCM2398059.1 sigma-70 family RNA polymerase sigma factor [Ciceribacter sp. S95]MCO5959410.1 sigma-70 family RNA polymerase sigma factor [Ciceribacter sp. S101]
MTSGSETSGKDLLDRAIEAYYDDLRNAVGKRGIPQVHATEVVHDLYVALSRHPESLEGKTSLRAFLIRAAVNLCIDRGRRVAFENRLFTLLDAQALAVPMRSFTVYSRIDLRKRILVLKNAIAELPHQCRIVFIAYRIGGLSKDEIASSLGIKRRMVDRHIRNALLSCLEKTQSLD